MASPPAAPPGPAPSKRTAQQVIEMFAELGLLVTDDEAAIRQKVLEQRDRRLRERNSTNPQVRVQADVWFSNIQEMQTPTARAGLLQVVYQQYRDLADAARAAALASGTTTLTPALKENLRSLALTSCKTDEALSRRFVADYMSERGLEDGGELLVSGRDPVIAFGGGVLARSGTRPARRAILCTARNLGIRVIVLEKGRTRIVNSLVIPSGSEMPVLRSRDFQLSSPWQMWFDVPVVEFESDDVYDVVSNYRFKCLPGSGPGQPIRVTFEYDINGVVSVKAVDLRSKATLPGQRVPYEEPDLAQMAGVRPRWVVLTVDTSDSTKGTMIQTIKQSLIDGARGWLALHEPSAESCKIGIVSFGGGAQVICQATSDLSVVQRAVGSLAAHGANAIDEGLVAALNLLLRAPQDTLREIFVLNASMPDATRLSSTLVIANECYANKVRISALGTGPDAVHMDFLSQITSMVPVTPDFLAEHPAFWGTG